MALRLLILTEVKIEKIVLKRVSVCQGVRRVGLETGVLVCLAEDIISFGPQAYNEIFSRPGLFFTHRRCVEEACNVLTRKKNLNGEEAKIKVNNVITNNKIEVIEKDFLNKNLAEEILCADGLHPPDCFILADFIKNRINAVYSVDGEFIKVANTHGIDARPFLHIKERSDAEKIKRFFRAGISRRR